MKANAKKAAKARRMYLRGQRKAIEEFVSLPPEVRKAKMHEAEAKYEGMIAKAKARVAEKERLQNRHDEFVFKVATLAAQIDPKLFGENAGAAIRLALKRLKDTKRILGEITLEADEKAKKAAAEAERAMYAGIREGYESAVRLITGETKNWSTRALPKFKRYVEARKLTEGSSLEKVLEYY